VKTGELVDVMSQLSLQTGTLSESLAKVALLTTKLDNLGADSHSTSSRLTLEMGKRRRMCEVIRSNDVENEKLLAASLMQTVIHLSRT
jgi:ribosomal protein S15P/S13E